MGWYNDGYGMMNGFGFAIFGIILMVLLVTLLVWAVVRTVDHDSHSGRHNMDSHQAHHSSEALAHLDMRLAKGEIPADEYAALKAHLKR